MSAPCPHLDQIQVREPSTYEGCEDCLTIGGRWVHLRMCMTCGHIGCCDSSPNKHATVHSQASTHLVVQSFEPGERWAFCCIDQTNLEDVGVDLDRSYAAM